jgi:hypothetical protein
MERTVLVIVCTGGGQRARVEISLACNTSLRKPFFVAIAIRIGALPVAA